MARINSLSILLETTGNDLLSELYGKVIENVQKQALSVGMKNMDLSGDPESGSVEAKRFANASSAAYGTARAAGAGGKLTARPVTVQIDTDKEIVEEIEDKDIKLYGVDGLLERRAANHVNRMVAELDRAFFTKAEEAATEVQVSGSVTGIDEILEKVIQACETTVNNFVDGVDRSMMNLVLSPAYYGKVRNNLDKIEASNVQSDAEEFYAWHGVKTKSCTRLPAGCNMLLLVDGAVAQPVTSNGYAAEKIPLSEAYAVSLFYHYGTKVVTPDLIFSLGIYTAVTPAGSENPKTSGWYELSNGAYVATTDTTVTSGKTYYAKS